MHRIRLSVRLSQVSAYLSWSSELGRLTGNRAPSGYELIPGVSPANTDRRKSRLTKNVPVPAPVGIFARLKDVHGEHVKLQAVTCFASAQHFAEGPHTRWHSVKTLRTRNERMRIGTTGNKPPFPFE